MNMTRNGVKCKFNMFFISLSSVLKMKKRVKKKKCLFTVFGHFHSPFYSIRSVKILALLFFIVLREILCKQSVQS